MQRSTRRGSWNLGLIYLLMEGGDGEKGTDRKTKDFLICKGSWGEQAFMGKQMSFWKDK